MKKNNSNKVYALLAFILFGIAFIIVIRNLFFVVDYPINSVSNILAIVFLLCSFLILFKISLSNDSVKPINNIPELNKSEEKDHSAMISDEEMAVKDSPVNKIKSYLDIIDHIRGEFNLRIFSENLFSEISKRIEIVQGVGFVKNPDTMRFEPIATFAYFNDVELEAFDEGEGIIGQVAKSKQIININDLSEEAFRVVSGLGESFPKQMLVFPIIHNDDCIGVFEMAFFKEIRQDEINQINELFLKLGFHFNRRIEDLYKA